MKINAPKSREKIRAKYGSVRAFAKICEQEYGFASLATAYRAVNFTLTGVFLGRRASPSMRVRERLAAEDLLVLEDEPEPAMLAG